MSGKSDADIAKVHQVTFETSYAKYGDGYIAGRHALRATYDHGYGDGFEEGVRQGARMANKVHHNQTFGKFGAVAAHSPKMTADSLEALVRSVVYGGPNADPMRAAQRIVDWVERRK